MNTVINPSSPLIPAAVDFSEILITHAPCSIALFDREMRYLAYSQQWVKDWGLSEPLQGKSYYEIWPETPSPWRLAHQQGLRGEPGKYEGEPVHLGNGQTEWVTWTVKPWCDRRGSIAGIIIQTEFITDRLTHQTMSSDRQRAAATIKAQQAFLQEVIDTVPQWLLVKNWDGEYLLANRALAEVFGTTPANLIGKTDQDFIANPEEIEQFRQDDREVMSTCREKIILEEPLTNKKGETFWVQTVKRPLQLPQEPTPYLLVSCTDLSQHKHLEEALRESEKRYQLLAETSPVGIFNTDREGKCIYVNQQACILTGLSPESLLGNGWLSTIHHEDQQRVLEEWQNISSTGESLQTEFRFLRPDSTVRWVYAQAQASIGSNGEIKGYVGTYTDITERKQVEETLTLAAGDLRTILNGVYDAIFLFDLDGTILDVNEQVLSIYRVDRADLKQYNTFLAYSGVGASPEQWSVIWELALAGEDLQFEWEAQRPQVKQSFDVEVRLRKISLHDRTVILANVRDITEQKQAEAELQRYKQAADSASDALAITDARGQAIYINPAFAQLYGCRDVGDFLERGGLASVFSDPTALQGLFSNALEGKPWSHEIETNSFQGQVLQVLLRANGIRDEGGKMVGLVAIITDISDRKQAEIALQESKARLQEQVKRERLLNALSARIRGSLDTPREAIIERALHEIRHLFRIDRSFLAWYNQDDHLDHHWKVVLESHAPDLPDAIGRYPVSHFSNLSKKLLRFEMLELDDIESDLEPELTKMQELFGFKSLLAIPLEVHPGHIGVLVCGHTRSIHPWRSAEVDLLKAAIDQLVIGINQANLFARVQESAAIAEAKAADLEQALEELQRTQAQLIQTEKMSSLGQLVAGVAHEINNPVNFIYGNLSHAQGYIKDLMGLLDLYQESYPNPVNSIAQEIEDIDLEFLTQDLPKLLTSMKVGADRIKEIVASLRNFSRMDEAEKKEVDIHEGIDSTLMILHNRLKATSQHSEIQVIKNYAKLPLVECYVGQLNQVFMNILSNAIDAMEERDQSRSALEIQSNPSVIRIETAIIQESLVQITIADNGAGIPAPIQSRLFDPFFTTKPIGKGTGLGLSISYQIITDKHGGKLECVSKVGEGTTFLITIPIKQEY